MHPPPTPTLDWYGCLATDHVDPRVPQWTGGHHHCQRPHPPDWLLWTTRGPTLQGKLGYHIIMRIQFHDIIMKLKNYGVVATCIGQ